MVMRDGDNNEEQNSEDIGNNPTEHIQSNTGCMIDQAMTKKMLAIT